MRRCFGTLAMIGAVLAVLAPAAIAADTEKEEDTSLKIVKIVLHPAAAPRPALKYQLLPPLVDRRPGNAVTQYLKAPHEYAGLYSNRKFWDLLDEWAGTPLPELRKEWLEKAKDVAFPVARPFGDVPNDLLEQLYMGARCESCDWALPIHEYDYDKIILAEIQSIRKPACMLAVRTRLQVADGKFDDAIETLQIGYALGRHVAQGPYQVQCLVGISIDGVISRSEERRVGKECTG
jgi:hypothetical protein